MKSARPIIVWAAIRSGRSETILAHTIRRTRAEAKAAYLLGWDTDPETVAMVLSWVRFAYVDVKVWNHS